MPRIMPLKIKDIMEMSEDELKEKRRIIHIQRRLQWWRNHPIYNRKKIAEHNYRPGLMVFYLDPDRDKNK